MAYERVNWKDYPDTTTPITASNLNKMDEQIKLTDTIIGSTDISEVSTTVTGAIVELKNFVSNGKKKIADAITAQGVTTATDAEFDTMATNIGTVATNKYSAGYKDGYSAGRSTKTSSKSITITQDGSIGNQNVYMSFSGFSTILGIRSSSISGNIRTTAECYINSISISGTSIVANVGWGDQTGASYTSRTWNVEVIGY